MDVLERLYRDSAAGFREALAPIVGSREAAGDVVQEAFATALRKRRYLRSRGSAGAWVWQIAFRLALRERRRRGLPAELPADITIYDEQRDIDLSAAIRTLPPQRRLVVFLHYFAGLSYAEVGEALGVAEGTVGATLTQARAALLNELTLEEIAR